MAGWLQPSLTATRYRRVLHFYFTGRNGQFHLGHILLESIDVFTTLLLLILPLAGIVPSIAATVASVAAAILAIVPSVLSESLFLESKRQPPVTQTLLGMSSRDWVVVCRLSFSRMMCFVLVLGWGRPWQALFAALTFAVLGAYDGAQILYWFYKQARLCVRFSLSRGCCRNFFLCLGLASLGILLLLAPLSALFLVASLVSHPVVAVGLSLSAKVCALSVTRMFCTVTQNLLQRLIFVYVPLSLCLVFSLSAATSFELGFLIVLVCIALVVARLDWWFNLVAVSDHPDQVRFVSHLRIPRCRSLFLCRVSLDDAAAVAEMHEFKELRKALLAGYSNESASNRLLIPYSEETAAAPRMSDA